MDWSKQMEESMKAWTEMQRKMLESWQETVKQTFTPPASNWERTVGAWETSLNSLLKAQRDWCIGWAGSFTSQEGAPEEAAAWTKQLQEMTSHWCEFQSDLWSGWFQMLRSFEPTTMPGTGAWTADAQQVVKNWQEQMAKMVEAQSEWLEGWFNQGSGEEEV